MAVPTVIDSYAGGSLGVAYSDLIQLFAMAIRVRHATGLAVFAFALLTCACSSHDEVLRITSPDGKVDAIVFEDNCGAPCSFMYEVRLARKGSNHGDTVAWLDAATRNNSAGGLNLKWSDSQNLSVEYLQARQADVQKSTVNLAGDTIRVGLQCQRERNPSRNFKRTREFASMLRTYPAFLPCSATIQNCPPTRPRPRAYAGACRFCDRPFQAACTQAALARLRTAA
jgi:hypothetical protein